MSTLKTPGASCFGCIHVIVSIVLSREISVFELTAACLLFVNRFRFHQVSCRTSLRFALPCPETPDYAADEWDAAAALHQSQS